MTVKRITTGEKDGNIILIFPDTFSYHDALRLIAESYIDEMGEY